ncbi:hypothetical protein PMIT1306_00433 [Prochlorococcus sp. MIT 1306]|nr:hypothetical protein PMIT1306_00433 [Prochlorococcus sp. MIT 1306]
MDFESRKPYQRRSKRDVDRQPALVLTTLLVRLNILVESNQEGSEGNKHGFTISLRRHPIAGTIEIICCLALVALELANTLHTHEMKQNQALQFLSLRINLFPQSNHQGFALYQHLGYHRLV